MDKFMQIMLTPAVQAAEDRYFGKHQSVDEAPERDAISPDVAAMIASRDSFYMATTNSDGWPYLQHRGGACGFSESARPSPNRVCRFQRQPPDAEHRQP